MSRPDRWNEKTKRIVAAVLAGATGGEVARREGCSRQWVCQVSRRAGLPPRDDVVTQLRPQDVDWTRCNLCVRGGLDSGPQVGYSAKKEAIGMNEIAGAEVQARLNITYDGRNGDLPDPVAYDMPDEAVRHVATEAVRQGYVRGIPARADASFEDFVVERFDATGDLPNRIALRPKTPFGSDER